MNATQSTPARNPRHVGLVWFVHAYPGQNEAHWQWDVYEHADSVVDPHILARGAAPTVEEAGEAMLIALSAHCPADTHLTAAGALARLTAPERAQLGSLMVAQDTGRLGFTWAIHTGGDTRYIDDALEGAAE